MKFITACLLGVVAAFQGSLIATLLWCLTALPIAGGIVLALHLLAVSQPFQNWDWNTYWAWHFLVLCSVFFANTFTCVLLDKDNWLNAMALTQDRKL